MKLHIDNIDGFNAVFGTNNHRRLLRYAEFYLKLIDNHNLDINDCRLDIEQSFDVLITDHDFAIIRSMARDLNNFKRAGIAYD